MKWAIRSGCAIVLLSGWAAPASAAAMRDAQLILAFHWIARAIEVAGVTVIVVGGLVATFNYLRQQFGGQDRADSFHRYRSSLGRSILLGLEFLVAADIIGTVAIEPSLLSLAILAGIVLIRTFLSFSLEVEIEGRWPWQGRPSDRL